MTIKAIRAETGPVEIQAAGGEDNSAVPTFSVVAYTGGALEVAGYDYPIVVDLDGMSYGNSLVANLDHERSKRVGQVTSTDTAGGQLVLSGVASAVTSSREEVVESAKAGFAWQASIEAQPTKMPQLVKAGKSVTVNGRKFSGPIYVASESTLKGFAFVSHGADDNTSAAIVAAAKEGAQRMDPKFEKWLEAMDIDAETLGETALANLEADFNGRKQEKPPEKVEAFQDKFSKLKAERKRQDAIQAYAVEKCEGQSPQVIDAIEIITAEAIEKGWTLEKFRLEILEAMIPQASFGNVAIHKPRGRDAIKSDPKVLEAAICMTGNLSSLEKRFSEQQIEAARRAFPHGLGLQELIMIAARAHGYNEVGSIPTVEAQRAAFGMGGYKPIHGAGFSTYSLSGLLGNSANKFLLDGWGSGDMAWSEFSARKRVRDFKTATSYRLHGSLTYEKVGPGGEIQHGTLGETAYTNKAETYGRILAATRQDIINDDLDAISRVPFELGVAAIDKLNNVFWTAFLDNSSFFSAGNSNVSTGAGSALALAGLSAAEVVFYAQTKPNDEPLSVMPTILLVPPTLKATALQLMNSALVVNGGTNTTTGNSNVWQGRFKVVTSPYMENSSYTGNSTAAWYLLADPMRLAVIEVAFLNGMESPTIETADADFSTLGFQMRAYHDFGVAMQEYRGGVRSAGS